MLTQVKCIKKAEPSMLDYLPYNRTLLMFMLRVRKPSCALIGYWLGSYVLISGEELDFK